MKISRDILAELWTLASGDPSALNFVTLCGTISWLAIDTGRRRH